MSKDTNLIHTLTAFDAVELEDSVLKASLPIKPPMTSSNLHGLVNFRHSQPGLQILTIRTTDCIHFLLPTISSLLLFDNMPLHHENTLVCYGTLSACDCGGYHAISPGKKVIREIHHAGQSNSKFSI